MEKRDWLTKDEAEAFVGKNNSYYLETWESHPNSTFKGWNWAAMFFGIEWMAYRKMYLEALLYYFILLLISIYLSLMFTALKIGFDGKIVSDTFRVLVGLFGNALYRKKALRTLYKTKEMSDLDRIKFLRTRGDVSVIGVVFCIIVEFIYAFLFIL